MLLMPRKVKYRKSQKGKTRGVSTNGAELSFGEFGLKALENGFIRSNHLEAARVTCARKLRGTGKVWFRIFPWKPVTKKPAETRQGKGKGDLDHWVGIAKRGMVLIEMGGVQEDFAKSIFRLIAFKFPIKTKFVTRADTH